MFMDRTPRFLLTLALLTTAAPAVASDFRGFFTVFIGAPLLAGIALGMGSILLRRYTAQRARPIRVLPLLTFVAAVPTLAWLGVFAQDYLYILMPTLGALWLLAAWHFWHHPNGRAAVYTARVLLVVTGLVGALMLLDMYNATDDLKDLMRSLWLLFCLASLVALALYVCIQVSRRPLKHRPGSGRVARQPTVDKDASPGGA